MPIVIRHEYEQNLPLLRICLIPEQSMSSWSAVYSLVLVSMHITRLQITWSCDAYENKSLLESHWALNKVGKRYPQHDDVKPQDFPHLPFWNCHCGTGKQNSSRQFYEKFSNLFR